MWGFYDKIKILLSYQLFNLLDGGESGIRTHGTVSRTHAFQACALSHSAISPDPHCLDGAGRFLQANAAPPPRDLFKYLNYKAISIDAVAAILVVGEMIAR
jgi:hypothetical protein